MVKADLSSIVISSRIRLARCLSNVVFPSRLTSEQGFAVTKKIADQILPLGEFKVYAMNTLPKIDAMVMHEKHLISRELATNHDFSAVVLSEDESISIMINEEDHIREQCILRGLSLIDAYNKLNQIDEALLSKLDIAYDSDLGFLNSCVTNIGTGMRASVMMFLPALSMGGGIQSIINSLASQGMVVRGVYGEGSEAQGYMYQISNSRALGRSEKDIIDEVQMYALRIAEAELSARESLTLNNMDEVTDRVYRAWGTLTNCYMISSSEFMLRAGEVKMGIAFNIIRLKDNLLIDKLISQCMPYSLSKIAGYEMTDLERDKLRATQSRNTLKSARVK